MTGTVITPRKLDINRTHEIYGHADIHMVQHTAQDANIKLTGTFKICPSCQIAKAKRKMIPHMTLVTASYPGERFFIDIAGTFPEGLNSYRYWAIFVDHYSRKKFSILLTKKSTLGKEAGKFLDYLKMLGKRLCYVQCDNAGENTKQLQNACTKRGIKMEFTAPNTPQQNGIAERAFATLLHRANAMMFASNMSNLACKKFWSEAVQASTMIDGLLP
jgi:transposase InsO family protein